LLRVSYQGDAERHYGQHQCRGHVAQVKKKKKKKKKKGRSTGAVPYLTREVALYLPVNIFTAPLLGRVFLICTRIRTNTNPYGIWQEK
jgi:hypothetical protein